MVAVKPFVSQRLELITWVTRYMQLSQLLILCNVTELRSIICILCMYSKLYLRSAPCLIIYEPTRVLVDLTKCIYLSLPHLSGLVEYMESNSLHYIGSPRFRPRRWSSRTEVCCHKTCERIFIICFLATSSNFFLLLSRGYSWVLQNNVDTKQMS